MHIAAAVGAPIVALFGPTSPQGAGPVQKPDGAPVRVLDGRKITGLSRAPIETHTVETVLHEVHELMSVPPQMRVVETESTTKEANLTLVQPTDFAQNGINAKGGNGNAVNAHGVNGKRGKLNRPRRATGTGS
jgi:hypothetical protein